MIVQKTFNKIQYTPKVSIHYHLGLQTLKGECTIFNQTYNSFDIHQNMLIEVKQDENKHNKAWLKMCRYLYLDIPCFWIHVYIFTKVLLKSNVTKIKIQNKSE